MKKITKARIERLERRVDFLQEELNLADSEFQRIERILEPLSYSFDGETLNPADSLRRLVKSFLALREENDELVRTLAQRRSSTK